MLFDNFESLIAWIQWVNKILGLAGFEPTSVPLWAVCSTYWTISLLQNKMRQIGFGQVVVLLLLCFLLFGDFNKLKIKLLESSSVIFSFLSKSSRKKGSWTPDLWFWKPLFCLWTILLCFFENFKNLFCFVWYCKVIFWN